ncbi:biopolymer transporter ExbD [Phaeobacter sp. HF9A]|uniref:ExbD/TolR family protein n=1 Tax=Phaeobacter sp. HF9A TaxID=2721561 RepID=UPI0014312EFC|nr:biopolymer transporter ExbD [Phaeobacter sp. HF9A]NIZ15461.1 biopolymer transporter ExbD [Phaeobacter sp. HF9A]
MDLNEPRRRPRSESIVPMINVVFLLLIFFLMTSRLAPADPFEVTLAKAALEAEAQAQVVLYVDIEGRTHFDGTEGDAALVQLAAAAGEGDAVQLRADAGLEAATLARILRHMAQAGLSRVELAVRPQ